MSFLKFQKEFKVEIKEKNSENFKIFFKTPSINMCELTSSKSRNPFMSTWIKIVKDFSKSEEKGGACKQTGIIKAENISLSSLPVIFLLPSGIIKFSERGFDNLGTFQFLSILFEVEN